MSDPNTTGDTIDTTLLEAKVIEMIQPCYDPEIPT